MLDFHDACHAYLSLDGWLTDQEALGLFRTASRLAQNAIVVEIGTWQGKSTYCLARGLMSGLVYAIDPFNGCGGGDVESEKIYLEKKGDRDLLAQFTENMWRLGVLEKIVVKRGYSRDFHHEFDKIDLLFIDGDHSIEGCKADFELYAPKIVSGGFIALHDYYADRDLLGPTYVIKNMILPFNKFKLCHQYDSLWVGEKI